MAACAGDDAPRVLSAAAAVGRPAAFALAVPIPFVSPDCQTIVPLPAIFLPGASCPPRHPARRRSRHPHSPIPPCRGFCPPPVFACAPREGRILEVSQRVPARRVALRAAGSARRRFLPAASPARASASTAQSYPCLTPAFSFAPPPASPVRPIPAPARVLRTALSLRAAGFAHPPREGWILAGSQRMPCPPRRPARRRFCVPRRPARRPHPLCSLSLPAAGFFLRSAARVPHAAYPCARPRPPRGLTLRAAGFARRVTLRAAARVIRTALSLRAAGFVRPPREGRILEVSQRVPCPPRRPARPPASSARPNPARRGFCPPPVFACALREGRILAGIQRPPVRVLRAA